jgi:hypothetical protein
MKVLIHFVMAALVTVACSAINAKNMTKTVENQTVEQTINELKTKYPQGNHEAITRGVKLTAGFWNETDGSDEDFKQFCLQYYEADNSKRDLLLNRYRSHLEDVYGRLGQISKAMQFPIHVGREPLLPVDEVFAAWSPYAHLNDDWFKNKIAMILHLNFPFYTLDERNTLEISWTSAQRAAANLGANFDSRVPAEIQQKGSEIAMRAELYISDYNFYMNNIIDEKGKKHFPEDMMLISHWGLRDELKSNYADRTSEGILKQQLIYELMLRIINQDVPAELINSKSGDYCPITNKYNGKQTGFETENNARYVRLFDNFKAEKASDPYCPLYPDALKRAFDQGLWMTFDEVEQMFKTLLSSPVNKKVAALISKRLGRPLRAYDIWYDGFKARSSVSENELTSRTAKSYPSAGALNKDLPEILQKLGFSKDRAEEICSFVAVDPARGSGHAMGAFLRGDDSRLRVRVPDEGLNYKGFNIAMHEFGHNVEQTISLYNVADYLNSGIPNTAFTEALAFIFQKRDLEVLGFKENNPDKDAMTTLDIYWGCYEIMGVSLVDMYVWQWMYGHPDASPEELKAAVINIARNVWNQYYAPVFGIKDSPILAIYSHMISYPLYLAAYPVGHLIEFQLEQHLKDKNFASEIDRIYRIGRRTPQAWMQEATGTQLSAEPIIKAADEAADKLKNKK